MWLTYTSMGVQGTRRGMGTYCDTVKSTECKLTAGFIVSGWAHSGLQVTDYPLPLTLPLPLPPTLPLTLTLTAS